MHASPLSSFRRRMSGRMIAGLGGLTGVLLILSPKILAALLRYY